MLVLCLSAPALAAWPEDVSLSSMTEHEGVLVADADALGASYRQLVRELGTLVAGAAAVPASTPGTRKVEVALTVEHALTEARLQPLSPSPWRRAHELEDNAPWLASPTLRLRKGLPLSTEVGGHVSWIAGSRTGRVGGWGKLAVVEGLPKAPELAVHAGYTGYVGNDELDLGVLTYGATLGRSWPVGRRAGARTGELSLWGDVSGLRITARPRLDDATEAAIGAVRLGREREGVATERPPTLLRVGAGLQIRSGTAFVSLAASWAPDALPALSTGMGVLL